MTAMQAKHLSGASIGKTIEWDVGRSLTTGERQWSPPAMLESVGHWTDTVSLGLNWGAFSGPDGWTVTDQDLEPDDWVRITAPPATEVAA